MPTQSDYKWQQQQSQKSGGSALNRLKEISMQKRVNQKKKKGKNDAENVARFNPFEHKFAKPKHDVLNRKVKGLRGRPGLTRKRSEDIRNTTLKPELKKKNKESSFMDRRFGENNPNLSVEDKMMARFIREKSKRGEKSGLFNLEEEELTHFGQSLGDMSDMDEGTFRGLEPPSDDEGGIDKHTVSRVHFGGFGEEEESDKKKTKAEIMKEIIAKSKFFKAERQRLKDENETLMNEVDDDLDQVRSLLMENSAPRSRADDYDQFVKELKFEKRAQPTDRTKTEEEIALEEKQKLEKLEAERLLRMQNPSIINGKEVKRNPQGDDLDDDLGIEDTEKEDMLAYEDGVLVSNVFNGASEDTDDDDDDDDDDEESQSEGSDDQDDEEDDDSDCSNDIGDDDVDFEEVVDEPVESENESVDEMTETVSSKILSQKEVGDELPYIFPAPRKYTDFTKLFESKKSTECDIIYQRLLVLYNAKLSAENKDKLKTLMKLTVTHIEKSCDETLTIETMDKVNVFLKHLHTLIRTFPDEFFEYARSKLLKIQTTLKKQASLGFPQFPKFPCLVILRLFSQVYSTSDFQHSIISPMLLVIGECLSLCPLDGQEAACLGISLCQIALHCQSQSQRFVPEIPYFLTKVLSLLLYKNGEEMPVKVLQTETVGTVIDSSTHKFTLSKDTAGIVTCFMNSEKSECTSIVIFEALKMIRTCCLLYNGLPSFIEIFMTFESLLDRLDSSGLLLGKLQDTLQETLSSLRANTSTCRLKRKPLQMQKRKPVAIPTFVPKFTVNYSIDKHYDPNRERADRQKLTRQYKKEFKGAARELRKDADFIAREKLKEVKEKDAQYKRKIDTIMGQLANQEGAMRGYEKEKKKLKR